MQKFAKTLSLIILAITAVVLVALQLKIAGWLLFAIGLATLIFCDKRFRRDVSLIYFGLGVLGVTPISTNLSYSHIAQMCGLLFLAVAVPYSVSRFIYKDHHVRFQFLFTRTWSKMEIIYVVLTLLVSCLFLPFALKNTGSYLNWSVAPDIKSLITLFLCTNTLGTWDELFFSATVIGILKRHLPFPLANLIQSVLFTAFLYQLGFRGWFFFVLFPFGLFRGYVFKKTGSLFYLLTIHLIVDLVLYLAIINVHYPNLMQIFLFK